MYVSPNPPISRKFPPLGWWSLWPDTPSPLVEHHDSWCQVPLQIQTQTWIIIKEMQFEKEEIYSPSKSMLTRRTLTIRPPPLRVGIWTSGKKCKKKLLTMRLKQLQYMLDVYTAAHFHRISLGINLVATWWWFINCLYFTVWRKTFATMSRSDSDCCYWYVYSIQYDAGLIKCSM